MVRPWFGWRTRHGAAGVGVVCALAALACGLMLGVSTSAAAVLTPPRIYWTDALTRGGAVEEANLDGTAVNQNFITDDNEPNGVAVDGQHIYWTNLFTGTIGEANLDGSDVNENLIAGASDPEAVAVDDQHIYWTNSGNNTIGEANLDGTDVNQNFIDTGVIGPQGVAVDGQHIYWTNFDANTIGEANLDGTDVNQNFIDTGVIGPQGVAVDGQHIYWTNNGNAIGEANLDGTDVNQSFITGANGPFGVAVDGQHIYWANGGGGQTIGEANVDGTGVNQNFIDTGSINLDAVAVSVPVAQVTPAVPAAFGSTPQGSLSAPLTLTLTNAGQQTLLLNGVSFAGADPGDFLIGSNTCMGGIDPGNSCQLEVYFSPEGQGLRSATLQIATTDYANSPLQVPLSGTGASPPTTSTGAQGPVVTVQLESPIAIQVIGPTGSNDQVTIGPQGPSVPAGRQGPRGPAGKIEVATCKTITKTTKNGRRHTTSAQQCSTRMVSKTVMFTTAGKTQAKLARARLTYATGTATRTGHNRMQILLTPKRPLRRGRYTLTLTTRGRVLERGTITIT